MTNLIGRSLGQYTITALLGRGGMAAVYRARQESMDRDVAIKVITPGQADTSEFIARFKREARTIASLSHAHILKVFDYGQHEDIVYLTMELLTGGSLADRIGKGSLEIAQASRLLDQIASALDHAHVKGIVHRDLKPQNVLLDEAGNAHLADFGIAKLLTETTALTQGGIAMGTPSYMAPEQWQSQALDGRADVYALGVMLFEMLTGKLPFNADTPFQMMYAHLNDLPRPVRALRAELPEGIERVLQKALAKKPAERYQTASALADAFRSAIGAGGASSAVLTNPDIAAPAGTARRDTSGLLAAGGMGAVIVLLLAVILLILGRGTGGEPTPTVPPGATLPVVVAQITPTEPPTALPATAVIVVPTSAPTVTPTVPPPFTQTPIPTLTPPSSPTATVTPTVTLDPIRAAETLFFEALTQTATAWTATPTWDASATIQMRLTALAVSSFTRTPLPSATPTATFTFTATFTLTTTATLTASPSATLTPLPTFTPAPPTFTPTFTPTPCPTLGIGCLAQVFVLDEGLKLREGPGTGFQVIENMPRGTVVTLVSTPRQGDGLTWWYVRLPNNNVGWAVQEADRIVTLLTYPLVCDATTLRVGCLAVVRSPDGTLNVRALPDATAQIRETLNNGDVVRLVGNPSDDTRKWWYILTPSGKRGWAASTADGDTLLFPLP